MRGTNYRVGYGVSSFFPLGGIVLYAVGSSELVAFAPGLPAIDDTVGSVFRLIGMICAGVGAGLRLLFLTLRARGQSRLALALTGMEGTAVVEKAETTNVEIYGMPQYRLEGRIASFRRWGDEVPHQERHRSAHRTWSVGRRDGTARAHLPRRS